jgi:hypothetical protein
MKSFLLAGAAFMLATGANLCAAEAQTNPPVPGIRGRHGPELDRCRGGRLDRPGLDAAHAAARGRLSTHSRRRSPGAVEPGAPQQRAIRSGAQSRGSGAARRRGDRPRYDRPGRLSGDPHPSRWARHPLSQRGKGANYKTQSNQSSSPAQRERGNQVRRTWWVRVTRRRGRLCRACNGGRSAGG